MGHVEILGTDIDNLTMHEVLNRIVTSVETRTFSFAVTPNVDHLMKLRKDHVLRSIYKRANLVLPDGVPLLWASKLLRTPLKERINGTDLLVRLCEVAAERGYSVYFLGGNPGTAATAATVLSNQSPGLRVAGWSCPIYGFENDPVACEEIRERIVSAKPDILFVGLGAPKQEKWIHKYARETGVCFAVGIGISFSLVCGELMRAPKWMQSHGFEWLWRLCVEPKRLWKRYLLDDMPFISLVMFELIRRFVTKTAGRDLVKARQYLK